MKFILYNNVALLFFDIIVIVICVVGFYSVYYKADLPFTLTTSDNQLFIENAYMPDNDFSNKQIVNSIDGISFSNWEEVELYIDGKNIGDKVEIMISQEGKSKILKATLTEYYSLFDLSIIITVGLVFIVFAFIVKIKAPNNRSANLFHLASIGLGMVILMTAGNYVIWPFSYGYVNRIMWLIVYSYTPVFFIYFTLTFIEVRNVRLTWYWSIPSVVALINVLVLSYFFINATVGNNIVSLKNYVFFFNSFFRLFVVVCVVIAISICIYAYKRATNLEGRKRLQWLLLGFFMGPFSFILFWVLPILLTGHSLIPESLMLIFLTAIPITFSIAIVKYQLMDINLIVRRSIVYSVILAAIIITYLCLSSFITLFFKDVNPAIPSVLTVIIAVIALQPIKSGIQKFVDKKFFKVEYNYREEQIRFLDDIKNSLDILTLAEKIVAQTDSLIPVDKIGFFLLSKPENRIRIISNKGWDLLNGRSIKFEEEKLKTDLSLPVAVDNKIEPGLNIESADIKVFKRWGMVLVFPVKSPTGVIHAFLALGAKKSGTRFFKEDIDLLTTVTTTTALAIDRIKLQEELILERLEAERLEELNKMKSFFVSTITHDLNTPLTSIKMFVELLHSKINTHDTKSKEYLKIIDGESEKLRRLIDNILDFTKIEKGMKSYKLGKIELNEVVNKVISDLQYQISMTKQSVEVKVNRQKLFINADSEAVERAIINLITNAIKYSRQNKSTIVSVCCENAFAGVKIQDEGRGMEKEQLEKIFDPFYRSEDETMLEAKGTGLGLAIVKHVMEAHNGKIEVESELEKGSTFSIWFPVLKDE